MSNAGSKNTPARNGVKNLSTMEDENPNLALTMQNSIIEFKTINYILFMVFC